MPWATLIMKGVAGLTFFAPEAGSELISAASEGEGAPDGDGAVVPPLDGPCFAGATADRVPALCAVQAARPAAVTTARTPTTAGRSRPRWDARVRAPGMPGVLLAMSVDPSSTRGVEYHALSPFDVSEGAAVALRDAFVMQFAGRQPARRKRTVFTIRTG